ncbi:CoA-acylating methylmalonate-semialdehyde dehydrogenase [Shewanella sp. 202IG2-18]|uniref:CoA-acylating methylmalonate-semialdehyde dehydrogenase n=1 Tax=Parashewanella hymeniacidonis TaxID=2807618 RepID=UPI001961DDDE|nr:CoA-acylating methylmalonate-semialdehyde dehydrogenase [Parashewanella hymeniacidonis]MBM7071713.1 CoA-acylating methylmalonate-semialdehyde dehydrogenase [Parashewanella hymeniacidonis]
MKYLSHLINGEPFSENQSTLPVTNPATAMQTAEVECASKLIVEEVILAATMAFKRWKQTSISQRAKILFRFKTLLEQHANEVCNLLTEEHGKVLDDARGELNRGIENIEYACGIAQLLKGEHSPNISSQHDSWSELQPLGVVLGVTPFNFPAMVPLWMWPMAVMCGNTFILKPSEQAPSAPYFICKLAQMAGFPPGVLNVINGNAETVEALLQDKRIKALSFVGSTPVAKELYRRATMADMRCQALGGAKNHAVVMPDADIDLVAQSLMGAAFGSCGERCMAISVAVVVGDDIAKSLTAKLAPLIENLKIGSGFDEENNMGPLISAGHKAKVLGLIEKGVEQGATLVVDGRQFHLSGSSTEFEQGYFLGGSLFDHVTPEMDIYQQEIFGPVLCLVRVSSLADAIKLINNHRYGNGTCIFTQNGYAAREFSQAIEVGMVGINVPLPVPMASHSFGGWKQSIFGDLSAYGPDAVRFYTQRKTITARWLANLEQQAQFSFPS